MKVGSFRRFSREDYKELPDWGEQFFQQLNKVLETHNNALSGGLTFGDNGRSEVVQIDLQNDTTTPIQLQELSRNPNVGLFGGSNYFEYPEFTWENSPDTARTVNVKVRWENPPDKAVRCVLIFQREDIRARNEN